MAQITLRLSDEFLSELESEADEHDVSRSEHIRDTLASRHEHGENTDESQRVRAEYEAQINDLETKVERLNRERRQLLELRDENQSLVAAREREVSMDERWRRASMLTRWRWRVTGMPDDEE